MEEMTVAEDREVADLLNAVKKAVPGGLKDVMIVFTADHGIPPSATWLASKNIDAGRIDAEDISHRIEAALTDKFGNPGSEKWVLYTAEFNFYFNPKLAASKKLTFDELEGVAKAEVLKIPGVAHVLTAADYRERRLPVGLLGKQILNGYYPGRSGDLVVIPRPFYMNAEDPLTHHTGYTYDRTVPVILAGEQLRKGVRPEHADVIDIAPTLSFLLGTIPPSLSEGRVLSESIQE
jgi:arylsulfatase A-like enzyme